MAWRLVNHLAMAGSLSSSSSSPPPPPPPPPPSGMPSLYPAASAETGEMKSVHKISPIPAPHENATMASKPQPRKRKARVLSSQEITINNECDPDHDELLDEVEDIDDMHDADPSSRSRGSHSMLKKRRLSGEQVKFLEASFTVDLKLEPERKALIAKQLGLRPRQVAIWFQNRRARWKNKRLEHEYEALKLKYEALVKENSSKKDGDMIEEENKRLHLEVARLTALLLRRSEETRQGGVGCADGDTNEISSCVQTTKTSPDLIDSDSESGSMKEHQSGKSEIASPTKPLIDKQSELQASTSQKQCNVYGIGDGHQHPLLFPQDECPLFENNHTFVLQHFVHGFNGTAEDFFSHWEDQAHAYTIWGV